MGKSVRVATVFVCQRCGKESLKWLGRCPDCQEWNSFAQQSAPARPEREASTTTCLPQELSAIDARAFARRSLSLGEFNRVLGGGLVPGSLVLMSGEPGIGKSTLLLQAAASLASPDTRAVYISGEETLHQVKLRAERLGVAGQGLFLIAETNLEAVLAQTERMSPGALIVDSIQTVYLDSVEAGPGSVGQVRECTVQLMRWAKQSNVPVLISGHVTKEGSIAGPRALEHIVDVVLYMEGEQFSSYRVLRCVKNRFGSTNEVAVFEMKGQGLVEVDNPSQAFISQRGGQPVGSAIVPTLEGSRPVLVEIQALTNPTSFGLPRRTANGIDFNRLLMIVAVLSRRVGLKLGNQDIIVNVTGGLHIGEPAADLGIALAIASSYRDQPLDPGLAAIGEIGLTGEIRPVTQVERRISEATRLGFKRCLVPASRSDHTHAPGIELVPVTTLREAVRVGVSAINGDSRRGAAQ